MARSAEKGKKKQNKKKNLQFESFPEGWFFFWLSLEAHVLYEPSPKHPPPPPPFLLPLGRRDV